MLRVVLLVSVVSAVVVSAVAGDPVTGASGVAPFPVLNPVLNPTNQEEFVSGSAASVPNLTSNFSSSAPSGPGASSAPSGPGASSVPPGYGIQQVFYPPPIFHPGMGGAYGSYPNFAPNLPSTTMMTQNQPSLLGLQGHASPVHQVPFHQVPFHQVPWYPTPASTCQGCNLIYRGLPYPGLVPNVQLPSNVQNIPNIPNIQNIPNVPYVRNIPLEPLSPPLVNNWMPHNVQPLVEPLVQNLPNLYSPEPVPSPVLSESVVPVPEPSSIVPVPESSSVVPVPESSSVVPVPESSSIVPVPESSSIVPVPESPVAESLSPKEAVLEESPSPKEAVLEPVSEPVSEPVLEVAPKEAPSSSRQKRTVLLRRSYGSYGYGSWPYYGYRSYLGGWPYYGYRSYYPYRSWGSWYPYW